MRTKLSRKGAKKMFRERILRMVFGLFVMAFVLWGIPQVADAEGEEQFTFEEICEMFGGEYTFEEIGDGEYAGACWVQNEDGEDVVVLESSEVPEETSSDGRYAKFYSSASNLVAVDNNGSFATKRSTYATTSASGFDKGQITQKNGNGGIHFEQYEPGIYEPILLFDLEIDVVRTNSETVEVTMRNTSLAIIDDSFWMTFFVTVPNNSNGLDGFLWQNKYNIPGPLNEKTIQISSSEIGYLDSANHWKFKAFSYVVPGDVNLSNNSDTVCNYEGNCP